MRKFYSDKRRTVQINPNNQELYFRPKSKKKNKVATKETHSFNSHPNKQQIHPKTGEIQSPKATQNFILDGILFFLCSSILHLMLYRFPFHSNNPLAFFILCSPNMIVTAQASFVIHLSNYSPSAHMTAQLTSTSHLPIIQLCKHLQRTSQQV